MVPNLGRTWTGAVSLGDRDSEDEPPALKVRTGAETPAPRTPVALERTSEAVTR